MSERATTAEYMRDQYGRADPLRARQEAHDLYSERRPGTFIAWVVELLDPSPGARVLDIGCGNGLYHGLLHGAGATVLAGDPSAGMVAEVRRRASDEGLRVWAMGADIGALPLPDGGCDAAMANHMLYHVPDIEGALRELRRVVAPGGRIVAATNAAESGQQLRELHVAAVEALGLTPDRTPSARFTPDHLPLVRRVFPDAEIHLFEDAFRFPTAEAALRYYASGPVDVIVDAPPDRSHRAPLVRHVEARIREIVDREGVFRVSKRMGCFVATVR